MPPTSVAVVLMSYPNATPLSESDIGICELAVATLVVNPPRLVVDRRPVLGVASRP